MVPPKPPNFYVQIASCDMPRELANIPLVFEEPVYGTNELTFTDFMAPGAFFKLVCSGDDKGDSQHSPTLQASS